MKQKITMMFLLIGFTTIAQINFEKGYFINNNGNKIECLIKNEDWKNNPKQIEIKYINSETIHTLDINSLKAFGILSKIRYERHTVGIDRSSSRINAMSNDRKSNFENDTLLLKLIVSGEANLYSYHEENILTRYFFNINNSKVKQLEYKKFLSPNNHVAENNNYRLQLKNMVSCKGHNNYENTFYYEKSLKSYFLNYNACMNNTNVITEENDSDSFYLYAKVGVNSSNFVLRDNDLGSKSGLQFGIEAEYVLPYNNGKWSIFIEPTYHSYAVNDFNIVVPGSIANTTTVTPINFESKVINTPIGMKHYLFLNNTSKLFVSAGVTLNLNLSSKISFTSSNRPDLEGVSSVGMTFGVGYNWNSKFTINAQFFTPNRFNTTGAFNDAWDDNKFKTAAISFGYRLF